MTPCNNANGLPPPRILSGEQAFATLPNAKYKPETFARLARQEKVFQQAAGRRRAAGGELALAVA